MKIQNNSFLSIEQMQDRFLNQNSQTAGSAAKNGPSFQDILTKKTESTRQTGEIKFSKHAANRLVDRNIELTEEQVERLNLGAAKAEAKANFEENRGTNTFAKAKADAKKSWDDAHMSPSERAAAEQAKRDEQIADANKRKAEAEARYDAAKVKKD